MTNPAPLTEEVRMSLIDAGIGKRFHDLGLLSTSLGAGMMRYLQDNGPAIRGGRSLAVHGVGTTDVLTLLARALHINGVGCRMVPLVRLRPIINDPEFRETVNDVDVLFVMNAQDTHRGNPLHNSVAAEVEYMIRKRFDNKRATVLQMAVAQDQPVSSLPECYWSDEFMSLVLEGFDRLTPSMLKSMGS